MIHGYVIERYRPFGSSSSSPRYPVHTLCVSHEGVDHYLPESFNLEVAAIQEAKSTYPWRLKSP
jgi:hypothetical protein